MAGVAAARSSPAGRLCTSPSTITPALPSPACCPISKAKPPAPSCAPPLPSPPSTASPFAACSPTTAPAIAPATSALPASNSASSTASPALTLRAPTARPNASSKPLCASGPMFATTSTRRNATNTSHFGSSITTSTGHMVVSVTLRPSAGLFRRVQRLDRSQLPLGMWADKTYESGSLILQPGDWLVIFTDGVIEAVNGSNEEYGEQRVINVLQAGAAATPEELLRRIMSDLD